MSRPSCPPHRRGASALIALAALSAPILLANAQAQTTFATLEELDNAIYQAYAAAGGAIVRSAPNQYNVWSRYDTDRDGTITRTEFAAGRKADRSRAETSNDHREVMRLFDFNGDGFLDGRETENGRWLKYDADRNGMVSTEEFVTGRTRERGAGSTTASRPTAPTVRPTPKPTPRPAPKAAPAAPVAPTAPLRLSRLAPRPGYVIGRGVFADGRPIPTFVVDVLGWYGDIHLGPTGTVPALGSVNATNGSYAVQTRDLAYTKKPVSALVTVVKARARLTYRGKPYSLALYPLDGKTDALDSNSFRGNSGSGVVRDFVLKTSGPRPGYTAGKIPLIGPEDSQSATNAYYGGTIHISSSRESKFAPGSVITMTFTPLGPLMDGSPSRVVTRSFRSDNESPYPTFIVRDIPLCAYTATATVTEPGGASQPMQLRMLGGDYQPSQPVEFEPTTTEFLGTVTPTYLYLTK